VVKAPWRLLSLSTCSRSRVAALKMATWGGQQAGLRGPVRSDALSGQGGALYCSGHCTPDGGE
jgi:hypothetical protein